MSARSFVLIATQMLLATTQMSTNGRVDKPNVVQRNSIWQWKRGEGKATDTHNNMGESQSNYSE